MSKFRVIFCTLLLLSGIFIVSEPSEIIPFIIFCFLVHVVTFGLWILAFWLMGPISIFLGLMHSFKWVANGEA